MSSMLSPRFCFLAPPLQMIVLSVALLGSSSAFAENSWNNNGQTTHHILEIGDTAWAFLVDNATGQEMTAHVNEGAAPPGATIDSWLVDNQTVAPVIVTTPGGTVPVPAGTSRVFLETDFDYEVDYTGVTPGATDSLILTGQDSVLGISIHQYEYDIGGQTHGVPAILVRVVSPVPGNPRLINAGQVWPIDAAGPVGSVASMMAVPALGFPALPMLLLALAGSGALGIRWMRRT